MTAARPARDSRARAGYRAMLVLAALGLSPVIATAAAPPAGLEALREVGHGHLRWLGIGIYHASLWSEDGTAPASGRAQALALSLAYERRFSRAELIRITSGEWQRLALADAPTRSRWTTLLDGLWHDVAPGDTLSAVVFPGGETRFYDDHGLLGRIADPAFGPAYLAIWLDPRTAVSDLRADLLSTGARR